MIEAYFSNKNEVFIRLTHNLRIEKIKDFEFKSNYLVFQKQFIASGRNFGYSDGLLLFLTATNEIAFVNINEAKTRGLQNIRTVNGVYDVEMLFVSADAIYFVTEQSTLWKYLVTPNSIVPFRECSFLVPCSISFVLQLKDLIIVASVRNKMNTQSCLAFSVLDSRLNLLEELETDVEEFGYLYLNPVHTMKSIFVRDYRIILASRVRTEVLLMTVSRRKLYYLMSKTIHNQTSSFH